MPDCRDNSCRYAVKRTGMRTNGGCRCDDCPWCGKDIRPYYRKIHYPYCPQQDWVPLHHLKEIGKKL